MLCHVILPNYIYIILCRHVYIMCVSKRVAMFPIRSVKCYDTVLSVKIGLDTVFLRYDAQYRDDPPPVTAISRCHLCDLPICRLLDFL